MYTSMCGVWELWSLGSHSEVFRGLSCCMSVELTSLASSQGLLTFDPSVKLKTDASELTHIRPLNKLVRNFFLPPPDCYFYNFICVTWVNLYLVQDYLKCLLFLWLLFWSSFLLSCLLVPWFLMTVSRCFMLVNKILMQPSYCLALFHVAWFQSRVSADILSMFIILSCLYDNFI